MIDPLALLAFLPAALALNLTPGADMMFCLGQGLRGGAGPALAASAGISTGVTVHVTVAALGLGGLAAAHPGALGVIRWIGVCYLLWLAWVTLRHGTAREVPAVSPGRAFRDGLLVNLTNPKVILFVLAFLPQFIDAARPVLPQFLVLGALLAAGGFVVNGLVGLFAGGIGRRLVRCPGFGTWLGRISAAIFALLAARLAVAR